MLPSPSTSEVILLLSFILQVGSGMVFLFVSFQKTSSSSFSSSSSPFSSSSSSRLLRLKSQDTTKLQLYMISCVNIVSGIVSYMKFTISISGQDPSWIIYVEWLLCTPAIVVILCLTCSIDPETIFTLAALDVAMIACGYIGYSYSLAVLKYTWFGFGCLLFVLIFLTLFRQKLYMYEKYNHPAYIRHAISSSAGAADGVDGDASHYLATVKSEFKLSSILIWFILCSWTLYPLVWILKEYGILTSSNEDIIYAVLAVVTKIVCGTLLLYYRVFVSSPSTMADAGHPLPPYHSSSWSSSLTSATSSSSLIPPPSPSLSSPSLTTIEMRRSIPVIQL
eukprot:TRINITY_DN4580_c0_g1_i1.p1 TRINITY_DN4580_c0_g1~~TRINITY_DN4580_c0_g1_i1.p1  ORF type:complete len:336 (-),score=51.73 TRINITY_DN4580_c0_g1_i1:46-1053(-)